MDFKIGNKKVGELVNGIFTKNVRRSAHLARIFDGWGIDMSVLMKLPPQTEIVINELEGNVTYKTTKEVYLEKGISKNLGAGLQMFLPRGKFVQIKEKETSYPVEDKTKRTVQTTLFKNIGL